MNIPLLFRPSVIRSPWVKRLLHNLPKFGTPGIPCSGIPGLQIIQSWKLTYLCLKFVRKNSKDQFIVGPLKI